MSWIRPPSAHLAAPNVGQHDISEEQVNPGSKAFCRASSPHVSRPRHRLRLPMCSRATQRGVSRARQRAASWDQLRLSAHRNRTVSVGPLLSSLSTLMLPLWARTMARANGKSSPAYDCSPERPDVKPALPDTQVCCARRRSPGISSNPRGARGIGP